jgi:hypothetical protein
MMPKTALIHIGTPKTGTTSIQECLAAAEAAGALAPYRYPLFRGDRNHNRLTMLYLPYAEQPPDRRVEFRRDDKNYQRVRREYRRVLFRALRSSRGAIISGEVMGICFHPSTARQFRSDLESLGFRDFHILLYVRDPADFYLSRTQNQLKLAKHNRPAVIEPDSFRYMFRPIAEKWEQAFPGRLSVRHYSNSPGYDVIQDFSDQLHRCLGITLPRAAARLNTTVSAEAMLVMQDYRQAIGTDEGGLRYPGLDRLVSFLRSTKHIPQTKPALKAEVAETVRANHRDDAEFIFSRYGVDLGLQGFGSAAPLAARSSWRVEDILESFDPDIVERLREEFARADSDRRKSLPLHVAKRFYRSVPLSRRPARLDGWLRSRFGEGPSA